MTKRKQAAPQSPLDRPATVEELKIMAAMDKTLASEAASKSRTADRAAHDADTRENRVARIASLEDLLRAGGDEDHGPLTAHGRRDLEAELAKLRAAERAARKANRL